MTLYHVARRLLALAAAHPAHPALATSRHIAAGCAPRQHEAEAASAGQSPSSRGAAAPISHDEFAASLRDMPLPAPGIPLVLAVSGGVDSMALALLAARHFHPSSLLAVVVDHGVRRESTEEARSVQAELERHGMLARVVRVDWRTAAGDARDEAPLTDIQRLARDKRYSILRSVCEELGSNTILMAHHADDQIETFFLRLNHKSGVQGLAGMRALQPIPSYAPGHALAVFRPLLKFPKERLRATCAEHGMPWFEDYTNALPKYQRNVIRGALQDLLQMEHTHNAPVHGREEGKEADHGAGLGMRERIDSLVAFLGHTREALVHAMSRGLRRCARFNPHLGTAVLDLEVFARELPQHLREHCLSRLMHVVSGREYPPRTSSSHALLQLLLSKTRPGADDAKTRVTQGRCLVEMHGSKATFSRQPPESRHAAAPEPLPEDGGGLLWDGRFWITHSKRLECASTRMQPLLRGLQVRFLGKEDLRAIRSDRTSSIKLPRLPNEVLLSLPVIVDAAGALYSIPHAGYNRSHVFECTWHGGEETTASGVAGQQRERRGGL
jgi:tRNA(Ile)-lysidine synthase